MRRVPALRLALVLVTALLSAAPAHAAKRKPPPAKGGGRRVGVLATGPSAAGAQKAAVSSLKAVPVADTALPAAAQKYGQQLGTDGAYEALALDQKLVAILRISTFDRADGALAVVQVRDGSTGAIVDDASWKAPNGRALAQTLSKQLKSRFGRSLAGTRAPRPGTLQPAPAAPPAVAAAPPASTPAPAPLPAGGAMGSPSTPPTSEPPPLPTGAAPPLPVASATPAPAAATQPDPGIVGSAKPSESSTRSETERPTLDLAVGATVLNRSFTYKDDLFASLQGYSLGAAIQPAAEVQWMPLFGGRLGLVAHVAGSVGLQSKTSDGTSYPTQALSFGGGVRWRFYLGEQSELGLSARYERQSFSISANASGRPDVPDVTYASAVPGIDARISLFGPVSLLAGVGYRYVLSAGEIASTAWFPHESAKGVEAMLGFGVALGRAFEVRIAGQVQRYGFTMNPVPGDPKVAGGATDTYLSGGASLAWRN